MLSTTIFNNMKYKVKSQIYLTALRYFTQITSNRFTSERPTNLQHRRYYVQMFYLVMWQSWPCSTSQGRGVWRPTSTTRTDSVSGAREPCHHLRYPRIAPEPCYCKYMQHNNLRYKIVFQELSSHVQNKLKLIYWSSTTLINLVARTRCYLTFKTVNFPHRIKLWKISTYVKYWLSDKELFTTKLQNIT